MKSDQAAPVGERPDQHHSEQDPSSHDRHAPDPFLSWQTFWERDRTSEEWVFEDVLARGRGHSIYAAHKTGKSLVTLFMALQIVHAGHVVVYLDYEMTEDDLLDRLADMGCGPETDLDRLRYALLPNLSPLDTREGARDLLRILETVQAEWPDEHVVVIIDTISRAVAGEENSTDTIRDFYRWTGLELKRRGITWVRLDHEGKDASRGQRGSSGKGDDVDVVWRLTRTQNGIKLIRMAARMGWVPDEVVLRQGEEPLHFLPVAEDWPAGTKEAADLLDALGVSIEASARAAGEALRAAASGRRKAIVLAAQKYRRSLIQEGAS